MNKKLPAVCLAIIALVLTAFPMRTFAAGDAVAASPNMIDLGEVKVTAIPVTPTEFMTNASGDTVMKYNASLSEYNINYSAVLKMDNMNNEYNRMRAIAGSFTDLVPITGTTNISITFDSKLDIDAGKLTTGSIQAAFESLNPDFSTLYKVDTVLVAGNTLTVGIKVADGVTGATIAAVGGLKDINITLPASALTMNANQYTDAGTIETSHSSFSVELHLNIPDNYKQQTYALLLLNGFTMNDEANTSRKGLLPAWASKAL